MRLATRSCGWPRGHAAKAAAALADDYAWLVPCGLTKPQCSLYTQYSKFCMYILAHYCYSAMHLSHAFVLLTVILGKMVWNKYLVITVFKYTLTKIKIKTKTINPIINRVHTYMHTSCM